VGVSVQLNAGGESTDFDSAGDTFANVERFMGTSETDHFFFYRHDVAQGYYVNRGGGDDQLRVEGGIMRGGNGIDSLLGEAKTSMWIRFDLS
jgi:hypothetical protein